MSGFETVIRHPISSAKLYSLDFSKHLRSVPVEDDLSISPSLCKSAFSNKVKNYVLFMYMQNVREKACEDWGSGWGAGLRETFHLLVHPPVSDIARGGQSSKQKLVIPSWCFMWVAGINILRPSFALLTCAISDKIDGIRAAELWDAGVARIIAVPQCQSPHMCLFFFSILWRLVSLRAFQDSKH